MQQALTASNDSVFFAGLGDLCVRFPGTSLVPDHMIGSSDSRFFVFFAFFVVQSGE